MQNRRGLLGSLAALALLPVSKAFGGGVKHEVQGAQVEFEAFYQKCLRRMITTRLNIDRVTFVSPTGKPMKHFPTRSCLAFNGLLKQLQPYEIAIKGHIGGTETQYILYGYLDTPEVRSIINNYSV